MGKKIVALIKLALPAGLATPAPPVGPALGQHGLNIASFCKEYNAKTSEQKGLIIPVEISAYEDRSYSFILKTPPASILIKKTLLIDKGSSNPNKVIVGNLSLDLIEQIAKVKLPDLNTQRIESAIEIIKGTAKNMGVSSNF